MKNIVENNVNVFFLQITKKTTKAYIKKRETLPSTTLIRITVRNLIDIQKILNEKSLFKNVLFKNFLFVFLALSFVQVEHIAT